MTDAEQAPTAERLQKMQSKVGKDAQFGDADTEIARVIRWEKNYYVVLKVQKDTPANEVRANYMKLSRLVHPDKCSNPQAGAAAAVLNQAHDTLRNPIKKKMYDAYVSDVNVDVPEGMSYAQWEAEQAMHPVQIPKWLESVLRIPGAGIILLLILFPLTLILIALMLVLWLVCLPVRCVLTCCGVQPPAEEQYRRQQEAAAGAGAGAQQV